MQGELPQRYPPLNPQTEKRSRPAWRYTLLSALSIVVAWAACIAVGALFTWLGHLQGCHLDEGGVHPCIVLGVDVGEPLNFLSVGLLLIAAFGAPLFLIGIAGCLVLALVQLLWHSSKKNRA